MDKIKCTIHNKPTNNSFNNTRNNSGKSNNKNTHIMVPNTKGLSECCKNICSKHDIQMHFKGGKSIRNLLVTLKDRDTILQKSGIIYRYKCGQVDCEEYVGETGRTFAERCKEHLKASH